MYDIAPPANPPLTLGSGSNREPSFSSTIKMTNEEMNPTSCVFPPAEDWMEERERLPAAVKELKKLPIIFMIPYARNS
jgi:hypothetical protein